MIKVGSLPPSALAAGAAMDLDHAQRTSKGIYDAYGAAEKSTTYGPEDMHTAIVGKTDVSNKAKKFLYEYTSQLVNTTQPLGPLDRKAPSALKTMKAIAGKNVTFVQEDPGQKGFTDVGDTYGGY
jgi:hypothetical protein